MKTSIKIKFRPSTLANHEGTIFYQIIHDRITRQLLTDYHIFSNEWDENRSMVIPAQKSERKTFILSIRERIRWDIERIKGYHTLLMMLLMSSNDTQSNIVFLTLWNLSS